MKLKALLLVPLMAASLFAQDSIRLVDGSRIDGVSIKSATFASVEFSRGGRGSRSETVPGGDVLSIELGATSPDFKEARAQLELGEVGNAAQMFGWVFDDEDAEDLLRALALIRSADAYRAADAFAEARTAYDRLISTFSQSLHVPRAYTGKAAMLVEQRDAGAVAALEVIRDEAESRGWGRRWSLEAEYLLHVDALLSEDADAALEGFRGLQGRTAGDYASIRAKCDLQIGRIHLARGELEEALALFNRVINDDRFSVERETVAGAFNGRGRVWFAWAQASEEAEEKQELFSDAVFDLMRVTVMYRDVQSEQAHALYWAGQAMLNSTTLDQAEARGRGLLKECETRFPGSVWGKRAAAE